MSRLVSNTLHNILASEEEKITAAQHIIAEKQNEISASKKLSGAITRESGNNDMLVELRTKILTEAAMKFIVETGGTTSVEPSKYGIYFLQSLGSCLGGNDFQGLNFFGIKSYSDEPLRYSTSTNDLENCLKTLNIPYGKEDKSERIAYGSDEYEYRKRRDLPLEREVHAIFVDPAHLEHLARLFEGISPTTTSAANKMRLLENVPVIEAAIEAEINKKLTPEQQKLLAKYSADKKSRGAVPAK